jgi:phage baseplate assembly protein W
MNMLHDLDQTVGSDLSASSTGDLLIAKRIQRSQQRLLRRLLTNPGDYLFHPDYGAGLPRYVGQTIDIARIRALIRAQVRLETAIAQHPAPQISVKPLMNGIAVAIHYADAASSEPVSLSFNVNQ